MGLEGLTKVCSYIVPFAGHDIDSDSELQAVSERPTLLDVVSIRNH